MLQMTGSAGSGSAGSFGSEGGETSGDGAGGCAAEGGVAAVSGAAEAMRAKVTGAGTSRGAHSDEDAPPGAGAGSRRRR
jgi:hypothetical protein